MVRGDIWWAELGEPDGSAPGYRRPVVIVQSDPFNDSSISTLVVVAVTSNLRLEDAPGNVRLDQKHSGLEKPSVVNVSQILTIDRGALTERVGAVPPRKMAAIDAGLRLVLGL